jgi:hypothetical protein
VEFEDDVLNVYPLVKLSKFTRSEMQLARIVNK